MNWIEEEKNWLKENYGKLSLDQCANYLKRPATAIRSYAVGVLKLQTGRQEFWTQEDHNWLVENYSKMSSEDCAKYLNRPFGSITSRAKKYGLHKSRDHLSTVFHLWSENEREWLIENFPHFSTQVCADHLNRPVGSVKSYAERVLKLKKTSDRLREKQAEVGKLTRKHFDIQPPSEVGRKEYSRQIMSKWRKENPERYNEICVRTRIKNHDKIVARLHKFHMNNRYKVLSHYSGNEKPCCECCNLDYEGGLVIDHINGGGTKHTNKVGKGSAFYLWLIKNNFPSGYRVLCEVCNRDAARHDGICQCPTNHRSLTGKKQ